jgi:hypothetical protein
MAVLLEGLVCAGYGVFLGIETVIADAADRTAAAVMAISAVSLGGGLVIAALAARHGRRAARAPILVWQLMQLSVAYLTVGTSWLLLGIFLAVLAGVSLVASLWPGVLDVEPPAE